MTQPVSPVPGLSDLVIIARGGYATVYKARQDSIAREVALKIDTRTLEDERDKRRFLREAEAAGRMSGHPHIVHVYDAGVTPDNHPYLVMELCTGGSYSAKMRKLGPRPADEVRDLGIKIADALQAAHDAGVLHRDVKPANILINRYDMPGLADFGLAAVLDASRDISVTVEALTPAYAPPEVFRLDKPTQTGDIYSLCATLYALLHGRPPRWPESGSPPSPLAMVSLHNAPIPDIPGVPNALVDVLRRGMANEQADRYQSATELRDAFKALNTDGSAPTTPQQPEAISPWLPMASVPPSADSSTEVVPIHAPPPVPARRRTGPVATLIGLTVAFIASTVTSSFLLLNSKESTGMAALEPARGPCPFVEADARCPTEPVCYSEAADGEMTSTSCDQGHDWQVFASASLPDTVSQLNDDARKNPYVATLCGQRGLETALDQRAPELKTSVLLPTSTEFAGGQREFQCLAGKKSGQLDEALFARETSE